MHCQCMAPRIDSVIAPISTNVCSPAAARPRTADCARGARGAAVGSEYNCAAPRPDGVLTRLQQPLFTRPGPRTPQHRDQGAIV